MGKEEGWVQCQVCGELSKIKNRDGLISDDDLYTEPVWCRRCRDDTKHLWCGDDIYLNYNLNLDPRFYQYKTIQND
jgi:hypothetical protein